MCSKLCYAVGGAPYQITGCALGFFLQIYLLDVAQVRPHWGGGPGAPGAALSPGGCGLHPGWSHACCSRAAAPCLGQSGVVVAVLGGAQGPCWVGVKHGGKETVGGEPLGFLVLVLGSSGMWEFLHLGAPYGKSVVGKHSEVLGASNPSERGGETEGLLPNVCGVTVGRVGMVLRGSWGLHILTHVPPPAGGCFLCLHHPVCWTSMGCHHGPHGGILHQQNPLDPLWPPDALVRAGISLHSLPGVSQLLQSPLGISGMSRMC